MKLRNKKTGEISELSVDIDRPDNGIRVYADGGVCYKMYNSLSELNEEWEDVPEEPKVGYIIDPMEEDCVSVDDSGYAESDVERAKELGIWFKTKEETERAVKKLEAWTRLENKGFRFNRWKEAPLRPNSSCIAITGIMKCDDKARKDLDICFGGKE